MDNETEAQSHTGRICVLGLTQMCATLRPVLLAACCAVSQHTWDCSGVHSTIFQSSEAWSSRKRKQNFNARGTISMEPDGLWVPRRPREWLRGVIRTVPKSRWLFLQL